MPPWLKQNYCRWFLGTKPLLFSKSPGQLWARGRLWNFGGRELGKSIHKPYMRKSWKNVCQDEIILILTSRLDVLVRNPGGGSTAKPVESNLQTSGVWASLRLRQGGCMPSAFSGPQLGDVDICHLYSGFSIRRGGCLPSLLQVSIRRVWLYAILSPTRQWDHTARSSFLRMQTASLQFSQHSSELESKTSPRWGGENSTPPSWLRSIVYDGWQRHPLFFIRG